MSAAAPSDARGPFDTGRVAIALAAVIGLILLLRWLAKGLFATSAAPRAAGAMKVLSRMTVSPKQQLLLVQVGRRVVVVGDCGTQMSALSEITDPDEIAALVGQINREQARPGVKGFGALFGRAQDPFKSASTTRDDQAPDDENGEEPHDATSAMTGEIAGLMEKIRNVSSQFRLA